MQSGFFFFFLTWHFQTEKLPSSRLPFNFYLSSISWNEQRPYVSPGHSMLAPIPFLLLCFAWGLSFDIQRLGTSVKGLTVKDRRTDLLSTWPGAVCAGLGTGRPQARKFWFCVNEQTLWGAWRTAVIIHLLILPGEVWCHLTSSPGYYADEKLII